MVRVAVVTRTKDRPVFLRRALRSVADQTYDDYIHVIVNDGGDQVIVDDIVAALEDDEREKVQVFHRTKSSGAPDTIFNESIDRVDSEYFAIHDDDDSWQPDFLAETVRYLDAHRDLGAVVVRTDKVTEVLKGDTIIEKRRTVLMPDMRSVSLYRQCIDNQMTPIATLYRRAAYQAVGKFDSTLPVVGDWEFGIRLLLKYDVDFLDNDRTLANYHHHPGSTNSFSNHSHRYYVTLIANRYLRDELNAGKLGVGYVISQLKYQQDSQHALIKSLLPRRIVDVIKHRHQS